MFNSELCLTMFEWEAALFVAFKSNASRRENVQCWWESLRYGDVGRFILWSSSFLMVVVWEK